jgi:molybdopterin molybdotransferase
MPPLATARLATPIPANGSRTDHIRAIRTDAGVSPVGVNDSAALSALAVADFVIVRPPDTPALDAGSEVPVIAL